MCGIATVTIMLGSNPSPAINKIKIGECMNSIKITLPRSIKQLTINTLSDVHLGDKECDMQLLYKHIESIKNDPNMYCILNGDLIDNATTNSVGDTYAATCSPMEQMKTCVAIFEPIKDKILSIATGNHEDRTYKQTGVDLTWFLANQLGVENRFIGIGGVIFLRVGEEKRGRKDSSNKIRQVPYTIYHTHGRGGGRRPGGKVNRLEDMASIIDTDIYIHSHTHLPVIMKNAFYRNDIHNQTISVADKLYVNTSANLNYGGYGQVYEFKPSSKANPIIILDGTKKDFKAIL